MVMRVYERVRRSPLVHEVHVATDSETIRDTVVACGGSALLTSAEHHSGTDRIAEASRMLNLAPDTVIVNVQGDQPLLPPELVTEVAAPLLEDPAIPMSTLIYLIRRDEEITHPNAVKTVFDRFGFALYFSRATIPFSRDSGGDAPRFYKHHGVYAYRNDFLQVFAKLSPSPLEISERLEQLRALENGFRIKVVLTDRDSIEVDTPEDLERVRRAYGQEGFDITRDVV
jgi:3-deoxy-manno-octulosonate cytidylyltransferase (CMP-KDO synthetase)